MTRQKTHAMLTDGEIVDHLKRRITLAGSQIKLANILGVDQAMISRTLTGCEAPAPKLLNALGFRRDVRYVRLTKEEG